MRYSLSCALVSMVAVVASGADGRLERVREQVRSPSLSPSTSSNAPSRSDTGVCEIVGSFFRGGDGDDERQSRMYASADRHVQWMPTSACVDDARVASDRYRDTGAPLAGSPTPSSSATIALEYGQQDLDLMRLGARLRWDASTAFGVETSWDRFYEA